MVFVTQFNYNITIPVITLGVKMYMLTTFEAKIVKQKRMTATHSAG